MFGYAAMVAVGTESHDVYTEHARFSVTVLGDELGLPDVERLLVSEFSGLYDSEPGMSWCSIESIERIELDDEFPQRHPCEAVSCGNTVQFADERFCYSHTR